MDARPRPSVEGGSSAGEILRNGFRDTEGSYLTANHYPGVWLSDVPLDVNEGALGATYLVVDVPAELVEPYEWIEDEKPYREALVPTELLNRYGPPSVVPDDEALDR